MNIYVNVMLVLKMITALLMPISGVVLLLMAINSIKTDKTLRRTARQENERIKLIYKSIKRLWEIPQINVMLDEGATMPTKAHEADAGYDIYAKETQIVPAKESATFDTGVHIEIPKGYVGMIKSKSGLNTKYGITSEGVIDSGYTGSIVAKLYNHSGYDYTVIKGDKITQLVIMPIADVKKLNLVDSLADTERGDNGFGSSGK